MTRFRWLAWVLLGLALVLAAGAVGSLTLPEAQHLTNRPPISEMLAMLLLMVGFPTVGAVVAWKRPENPIGWIFCLVGLGVLASVVSAMYIALSTEGGLDLPATEYAAWLNGWGFFLGMGLATTFALLLFPTGRLPSPRWRPVALAALLALGAAVGSAAFAPGLLATDPPSLRIANPFGLPEQLAPILHPVRDVSPMILALIGLLCAASLAMRFRAAGGVERQQLKWFLYPALLGMTALLAAAIVPEPLTWTLATLGFAGMPLGAGIAILRHRLYDIDLLINRTLVYGALTASLAAVYIGLVILLQGLLSEFAGGGSLAVAASTLAVAALFQPLRRRIQRAVDRRFYRSRYDAARTIESFSARLRNEVDIDRVTDELRAAVDQTLQPAAVTVWLRKHTS